MNNNDIPTTELFALALLTIQAVLTLYDTALNTKKGSVIRLLLVRPYAYIYTYLNKWISTWFINTSVAYLKQSQKTLNLIADLVASNYFIVRNLGNRASGTVLVSLNQPVSVINTSILFLIDSVMFRAVKSYVISSTSRLSNDLVEYVKPIETSDNKYKVVISVLAILPGVVLVPSGVLVTTSSYIQNIDYMLVFSPITGGRAVETDAQMMQRCLLKCSCSVGTLRAISCRLKLSNYPVLSCNSIGTMLAGQFRSRRNNLLLPVISAVDTYVKTQNQPAIKQLTLPVVNRCIELNSHTHPLLAGAYSILVISTNALTPDNSYTVLYLSADPNQSSLSVRLSAKQKIKITFNNILITLATLRISYMPFIDVLQKFILNKLNSFIGLNILIKAAIPVKLNVSCQLKSYLAITLLDITQYKLTLVELINNSSVGHAILNMDLIALAFRDKHPLTSILLPYSIRGSVLTTQGNQYTFNTTNGIISVLYRPSMYLWLSLGYFFYVTKDNIQFSLV